MRELIDRARRDESVYAQLLADDTQLLVYPLAQGALVALGYERGRAHLVRIDDMLRRRARQLSLIGAWLPLMLADGSWYLARRLDEADGAVALPGDVELAAVRAVLQ